MSTLFPCSPSHLCLPDHRRWHLSIATPKIVSLSSCEWNRECSICKELYHDWSKGPWVSQGIDRPSSQVFDLWLTVLFVSKSCLSLKVLLKFFLHSHLWVSSTHYVIFCLWNDFNTWNLYYNTVLHNCFRKAGLSSVNLRSSLKLQELSLKRIFRSFQNVSNQGYYEKFCCLDWQMEG